MAIKGLNLWMQRDANVNTQQSQQRLVVGPGPGPGPAWKLPAVGTGSPIVEEVDEEEELDEQIMTQTQRHLTCTQLVQQFALRDVSLYAEKADMGVTMQTPPWLGLNLGDPIRFGDIPIGI